MPPDFGSARHNLRAIGWFVRLMQDPESDPVTIELDHSSVRRVKRAPRRLFAFYLLPVSLAGLAFTLYAYGWPIPVAGCAVLVGIAIGVLLRERN